MSRFSCRRSFVPTHQTEGCPGIRRSTACPRRLPTVGAPAAGEIVRFSATTLGDGGVPGGAYGWSIYLVTSGAEFFLTIGSRTVQVGDRVTKNQLLGTVCDAAVAHMASSLSHIHEGRHEL